MRTALHVSLALLFLLSVAACGGRRPGPHKYERGRVTQWRVEDSSIAYDGCTDAPLWRSDIDVSPVTVGWYVAYMLSEDGTEAPDYDCDTTDTRSCYLNPAEFTWQVEGHTVTYDPPPWALDLTGTTCQLQLDRIWILEDEGTTAVLRGEETVSLIGDSTECGSVEDQIRAESPNGLGFQGCTATVIDNLSFFNSATP